MVKITPVVYFAASTICSIFISLILEHKMSKVSSINIVFCYSAIMVLSTFLLREIFKAHDPSFDLPKGELLGWFVVLGIFFVICDISHAKAFNLKGTAEVGLQIQAIAPVAVALFKYFFYKEESQPSLTQIIGYIIIFAGMSLVFTGKVPK